MILGFAHITANVAYQRGAVAVANAPAKWPLMAKQATLHWITLPQHNGLIAEENVEYDTGVVEQPGRLGLCLADGPGVLMFARSAEAEAAFLIQGLGFADSPFGWVEFASHIPEWRVRIYPLSTDAPLDPPLDIRGYAALAFYSTDVESDRDRCIAAGGRTPTEPFTVTIKDREMKIIMLRSPEGTIIELIQIIRPPRGEELEWAKREAQKLGLT